MALGPDYGWRACFAFEVRRLDEGLRRAVHAQTVR
jgi:hypothetical protein